MNKSLMPKIRFKGFNDEWKKYKINEIYKLKRGCVISKEILFKNKETNFFPVYSSQTSNNGIMGWTNIYLFEKNKIIWTTDGANAGTIRFVSENFYASNVCGVLIGKKDHYNNYSFAIAISLEAKKHVNKNGNPKLMNNIMGNINFYNSKLKNEQTKIADFFTIIDRKIELIKEQLNLLEKQKQYYLNNMFANKKSYPKIRFKGFNNEWKSKKIKEILNYQQPTKFIVKDKIENQGKIPVLTANKSFILGYANEKNIYENIPVIIFDDFTMDMKYVNFKFMVKSSAIKILKSKTNNINLFYVFNLLKNLKLFSSDHKRYYISYVSEINVLFPNINEQTKVAHFFTIIDRKIELIKEQLSLLEKQKQYYLNNMFI
ncbi:restriction endonuclease subunit S [Spiroplasma endosymbiont of Villa modesta]|uniref:restriction endonuclease subunit S n=1 Tax=Spiroplasma endosymbiont of Villa modesta TaxID=3066293 RepID=UPI00313D3DC7